jgi:hypothetical protein
MSGFDKWLSVRLPKLAVSMPWLYEATSDELRDWWVWEVNNPQEVVG